MVRTASFKRLTSTPGSPYLGSCALPLVSFRMRLDAGNPTVSGLLARNQMQTMPRALKLHVTHHDALYEPTVTATHASSEGPSKLPTLKICCISPITAATDPSGGARSTANLLRIAGTVPPIIENARAQTSCPMRPSRLDVQSTEKTRLMKLT